MSRQTDWPNTSEIRAKRREPCRNCGRMGVQLHHAIPRSMCLASAQAPANALPLCGVCHQGFHTRTITITRDVFTPHEWAYLASVAIRGRDTMAWLDERYPESEGVFA